MDLRSLKEKDSAPMLEWMHDEEVVEHLHANFKDKTKEDALDFILNSKKDTDIFLKQADKSAPDFSGLKNLNFAIADEDDEYLGTVSLKNINLKRKDAEFAISIRKCAMGKGISKEAMKKIIKLGFEKLNLKCIYWYVDFSNKRAIRFYDKNCYNRDDEIGLKADVVENPTQYLWYSIKNS